jgi:hypothetical protein
MLVRLRFHFPEIVIGVLIAVAIFALGMFFSSHPANGWLALLTGFLAASTVGVWFTTIVTLRHNRKTAERQLRAYVLADGGRYEVIKGTPTFSVTIRNFGQTPAYKFTAWMDTRFHDFPSPKEDHDRPQELLRSSAYLGPNSQTVIECTHTMKNNEMKKLKDGSAILLIVGDIQYSDIFRNTHLATFCFAMGGTYGIPGPDNILSVYKDGNEERY